MEQREYNGADTAVIFIRALVKSMQSLCHGYLDFQTGIEIIGHINISVDKGKSLDYILKESVCKNEENSTLFISNSFHAESKKDLKVQNSKPGLQAAKTVSVGSVIPSAVANGAVKPDDKGASLLKSQPIDKQSLRNTEKRETSEDKTGEVYPVKIFRHDYEYDDFMNISCDSSLPVRSISSVESKETVQTLRSSDAETCELDLQHVGHTGASGVNLVGSVLESMEEDQSLDLLDKEKKHDCDWDVTFIKKEHVEENESASGESFSSQHFIGSNTQRAVVREQDRTIFPISLHKTCTGSVSHMPKVTEVEAAEYHYVPGRSSPHQSNSHPEFPATAGTPVGKRRSSVGQVRYGNGDMTSCSVAHYSQSLFPFGRSTSSAVPNYIIPKNWKRNSSLKTIGMQAISTSSKTRTVRDGRNFNCEFCGIKFASYSGLRSHKARAHLNTLPYWCSICGKGFTKPDNYEGHMNMHNNIKAFKCPYCSKQYPYKTSLNLHLRTSKCQRKRMVNL